MELDLQYILYIYIYTVHTADGIFTKKLNETELRYNISASASWHNQYKDSAWVFIGGLPYDLSEGDVICIFSQ